MLEVLTECVRNNMQWDISRTEYTTHNIEHVMLFDADDDDDDAACLKVFIWTPPTVIIFLYKTTHFGNEFYFYLHVKRTRRCPFVANVISWTNT